MEGAPSGRNRTGAHARSESVCCGDYRMPSRLRLLLPFTPCSIATGWSRRWAGAAVAPKERLCRRAFIPTISGAPITRASFSWSDKRYCYPLTVTDYSSRYLLLCEALESNREDLAFPAFERLFHQRGLPRAIRSDNGVPFASPHGLFQLSKLSVWWLRLDISIERIRPGHPQQNGRHERMHLTLKKEATRPAGANILQQQAKFNAFLEEFNHERPHEALAMKCPAEVYSISPRPYRGIPEPHYPFHDRTVVVTSCGRSLSV
jgi:transposase InsO family protein